MLSHRPGMTACDSALALTSLPEILLHVRAKAVAQLGGARAEGDVGAREAGLGAAIMALAGEFHAVEILRRRQPDHGVGELDLAARAALLRFQDLEDFRL